MLLLLLLLLLWKSIGTVHAGSGDDDKDERVTDESEGNDERTGCPVDSSQHRT